MPTITRTSAEDTVAAAKTYERIKAVEDAVSASGRNSAPFDIQNFSGTFSAVQLAQTPKAKGRRTGRS